MAMKVKLKDKFIWLSEKNEIELEIENGQPDFVKLENGEGYRVIGRAERSTSTGTGRVSFEVEFARTGEVTLSVGCRVGLHPYRVESLHIEVISPLCHERGVSPYTLKRPGVRTRLKENVESMRSGMLWVWGLPQVGKTTAIREWRERHPRSVYINLADWKENETLYNLVFRLVRDQLADDSPSDKYEPSLGASIPTVEAMWRVIIKWTKRLNERFDTDAILILDQFHEAFRSTSGSATLRDLLLTLYKIPHDVEIRPLRFKWIVVDVLPFEIRRSNMVAQWPQQEVPQTHVEPFEKKRQLRRYVSGVSSPPGLALSALQKALRSSGDAGSKIISRLHALTGGHPALLNVLLCHMESLYHDGKDIAVVVDELRSSLLRMEEFGKAVQEAALHLWRRYQSDLLAGEEELQAWIRREVSSCRVCPLLLNTRCTRGESIRSSDQALSLQRRGILIDRDQAECVWLSPWVARAIDEECR